MRLPVVDAKKLIKILDSLGYRKIGQSGSHVQFKNDRGSIITIPLHPGRNIGVGLLRKIIRDMEITREEFTELAEKT